MLNMKYSVLFELKINLTKNIILHLKKIYFY